MLLRPSLVWWEKSSMRGDFIRDRGYPEIPKRGEISKLDLVQFLPLLAYPRELTVSLFFINNAIWYVIQRNITPRTTSFEAFTGHALSLRPVDLGIRCIASPEVCAHPGQGIHPRDLASFILHAPLDVNFIDCEIFGMKRESGIFHPLLNLGLI